MKPTYTYVSFVLGLDFDEKHVPAELVKHIEKDPDRILFWQIIKCLNGSVMRLMIFTDNDFEAKEICDILNKRTA